VQAASDLELARAARRGSADATSVLMERLRCVSRMMRAHNARHGHLLNEHDLDDAVQDALLVAWRKLGNFTGTGVLEVWVHRICTLEFLNAARRRRRRARRSVEAPALEPCEDEARIGTDPRDRVQAALELLGGPDAELLRMRHFQALPFDALGRHFEVSTAAIKRRYYRALERLGETVARMDRREAN